MLKRRPVGLCKRDPSLWTLQIGSNLNFGTSGSQRFIVVFWEYQIAKALQKILGDTADLDVMQRKLLRFSILEGRAALVPNSLNWDACPRRSYQQREFGLIDSSYMSNVPL